MSCVARPCEAVAGEEKSKPCPEAGCRPVEEEVLTFDAASSDPARSQQFGHEQSGLGVSPKFTTWVAGSMARS
ncbi:MAG: hypothetical protein H6837_20405 [Planctomycetes bacterium]|nr:hypothetical protein [Planctomycetota bacterium]